MKKSATKRFGYEMDANLVFEDVTQELEGDRKIDWGSLVGTVRRRGLTSVELHHRIWSERAWADPR